MIPAAILAAAVLLNGTVFAAGLTAVGEQIQFLNGDGIPVTEEFRSVNGKNFYFDTDGNMVKDQLIRVAEDLYYVDSDGVQIRNAWKKLTDPDDGEAYWFWFGQDGKAFRDGWKSLGGKKYHFTGAHMDTGWFKDQEGNVYYLGGNDDGAAESGWLPYKGTDEAHPEMEVGWYYFSPATHRMFSAGEKKIGKNWYAFSDSGCMVDGFAVVENDNPQGLWDRYQTKYYEPISGARANGWKYVDDSDETAEDGTSLEGWYYFKNGIAYSAWSNTDLISSGVGVAKIDGNYYAFDTQGRMVKGLVLSENDDEKYDKRYYYFGPEGQMQTGRVNVTDSDLNCPAEEMYFDPRFSAVPAHGMSVTGEAKGKLYDNGVPVLAEKDRYELVTLSNGKTYVVSSQGTLKKSGTVVLENEAKMKISYDGENYSWEKVNS